MTPPVQTLNVIECVPGPSGERKDGSPWTMYHLEVTDEHGERVDGKFNSFEPMEPGLADYGVSVRHSEKYGTSYTLRPLGPPRERTPEPQKEAPPVEEVDRLTLLENTVAGVVRRQKKTEDRLTSLANLVENREPVAAGQVADEDIPF